MDALERLRQLGQVEPVDQAVLDAALRGLAEAIGRDAACVSARGQAIRRRSRRISGTAVAAALSAAAVFAALAWLGHSVPATRPAGARVTSPVSPATAPGSLTIGAVLTAFRATSDDILMVSKVVRGEGTCCKTLIWISPAATAPGRTVLTRIKNYSTGGTRLSDIALSYTAPASTPAAPAASVGCGGVFLRPRVELPPAPGIPGTMTQVDYAGHLWVRGDVRVQPATMPSAAPLRACLKDGQWRDAGRRLLAGVKVIELVSSGEESGGTERLWVSASTFLPVRLTSIAPTPYGPTIITFAFKFLRPTAANRASLAPPPVPAGFSRQRI